MRFNLGQKLFLYTSALLVVVLLATFLVLERSQAQQWERHFLSQSVSFARLSTPELLKRFRGEFSGGGIGSSREIFDFLAFNRDLIQFSLLSPSGRVLYQSPRFPDYLDLESSPRSHPEPLLAEPAGSGLTVTRERLPDGGRALSLVMPAFGPTGEQMLTVRYLLSYDSVDLRIREVRWHFLRIAGLSLLFALLLAALVARRLVRPIAELTRGVRFIGQGELQTRIETGSRDEIGTLGQAFNEMAENLLVSRTELTRNNEALSRANAELRQMQEHMVRSERLAAIGQLAAGVSHEIDNPVGIILGFAELMLEDCPPEDPRREDLQAIIEECKRCRRITGGLLGFARSAHGLLEPVHLGLLVNKTLASLRPQKLFKGLELRVQAPPELPTLVADADQLRQVLVNLFLNAAQVLDGRGQILVDLGRTDVSCWLTVSDSGPGIPPELRERVFEPFYSTKGRGEGTGLGLSVCRRLVEDHGGRLTVHATGGGGACFRLELPLPKTEKYFDKGSANSLG